MKILLLGPTGTTGSLPPYLDVLEHGLRTFGNTVHRHGSTGVPYDTDEARFWEADRIICAAEELAGAVDFGAYDVISLHFGNLEIEQILPLVLPKTGLPPVVYHVHSLDWTRFTHHVAEPSLRMAVDDAVSRMDGYVFFGAYGERALSQRIATSGPTTVSWLPTTIANRKIVAPSPRVHEALTRDSLHVASLYGYAAPWKDPATLAAACAAAASHFRVIVAGPSWDDTLLADGDIRDCERSRSVIACMPFYLDAADRYALVELSDVGVFPYRQTSTFQGSGAVADYLAHGTPLIATDVANMAELIDDAGVIVPPQDPSALATAMDQVITDHAYRHQLARAARRRAPLFTAARHAVECLRMYDRAIARKSAVSTWSLHARI